jgi:hypothetical protein
MIFRLNDNKARVSRQDLADPHRNATLEERLAAADAIDLRDNALLLDAGNGYVRIDPIDPKKRWTKPGAVDG